MLTVLIVALLPLDGYSKATRYAERSVLSSGQWVKVRVENNGLYKITYEELVAMGVSNPGGVRVYGYGGEMLREDFSVPYIDDLPEVGVYMSKGGDGVFSAGDYIIFYGQGATGWDYEGNKFVHTQNVYSNYGYYFLTWKAGEGKRLVSAAANGGMSVGDITSYTDYYVYEKDKLNIANTGKVFYGEVFQGSNARYNFNVSKNNILSGSALITTDVAGKSTSASAIYVSYNGMNIDTVDIPILAATETIIKARSALSTQKFNVNAGSNISLSMVYNNPNKIAWLNYFELNYKRLLKKESGASLFFRNVDYLGSDDVYTYKIAGQLSGNMVWDVTDKANVKNLTYTQTGGYYTFVDSVKTLKEYVVVNPTSDAFYSVVAMGKVPNQNLHALPLVDMIIIANEEFVEPAKRLADWHREENAMSVAVVDANVVYNEFSSGNPDATAYRRFAKMFYDRESAVDKTLKYVLLFGDGSFDNRQILKAATDKNIYRLLTYQSTYSLSSTSSYATDDYFGLLDDTDGQNLVMNDMDVSVGRIPVHTLEQADAVVDKLINYMGNTQYGVWKNRMVFIADDGDANEHVTSADAVAKQTQNLFPDMEIKKIYLDAYNQEVSSAGATYPTAKREFDDYVKYGTLLINYMGHGGYNGWTDEQILSSNDIENMYNDKMALWVTATCDFSRFDDFNESGGERLLYNPNGGAMGLFTTSRTVYARPNKTLNLEFMDALLSKGGNGEYVSIGEAVRMAKNSLVGDANRLSFILLGDPATKLNFPVTHKVAIDSINGSRYEGDNTDTIKALQEILIKGSTITNDGVKDGSFNGVVHLYVYDKEEEVTTLCNDAGSVPFTYLYRNSKLFSGSAKVKDGEFEIEFRLPKDIRYNYGTAKIVAYAYDETNGYEGNGSTYKLIVGGEDEDIVYENDGPEVEMYLNSVKFEDGDDVNKSPLFVAKVYDESGINTIGSGIGHDMILRLNNDAQKEYVLNTYYVSNVGDYKRGELRYQLADIEYGDYELMFRVWDLQNNSTTAFLNFSVSEEVEPSLYSVVTYPNPTTDVVNYVFTHNRPSVPVGVKVEIFDITGQKVWMSEELVITDFSGETSIQWRLQTDNGVRVGEGLYLSKVTFTDENGENDVKTTKILVR